MTLLEAVQYLLLRRFPPRDIGAALAAKARGEKPAPPPPEQIEYRAELEAKPLPELLGMVEAAQQELPRQSQVSFLVARACGFEGLRTQPPPRPAAKAYRARLEAMSPAELADHRAAVLRGNGPTQSELDEGGYPWNSPEASADLQRWALEPLWTADEALALSFGREPAAIRQGSLDAYVHVSAFAAEFEKRRSRFVRAIQAGDMQPQMRPFLFITWGRQWGVSFPDELQATVPFPIAPPAQPLSESKAPAEPATPAEEPKLPAMDAQAIADYFRFPILKQGKDEKSNLDRWKKACSEAASNGLASARVSTGIGTTPSTFDPESVASWIVAREPASEHRPASAILKLIGDQDKPAPYAALRARWEPKAV